VKLSSYFYDLRSAYQAELDDLVSDSEGKDVLRKRLAEKRSEIGFLVKMMELALAGTLGRQPGSNRARARGAAFMVVAAGLEYLHQHARLAPAAAQGEADHDTMKILRMGPSTTMTTTP
jgi:hypothetical protein